MREIFRGHFSLAAPLGHLPLLASSVATGTSALALSWLLPEEHRTSRTG